MKRCAATAALAGAVVALGCEPGVPAGSPTARSHPQVEVPRTPADPFAAPEANARTIIDVSPHRILPPVLLQHGTVMTATGKTFSPGYVLIDHGEIADVGEGDGPALKPGTTIVDATGKFVTPGIIDPHSHMGVYAVPETAAHDDGNELTDPVTAGLRAEHSFWPQDPAIERAVAGGVT